jgi:hypothetical protein
MELSLPAWLGALCGMFVAVAVYVPFIRIVERRWRARERIDTADQRAALEQRLSIVRRVILGLDIAALAVAGYWIGNMLGGKGPGATGG